MEQVNEEVGTVAVMYSWGSMMEMVVEVMIKMMEMVVIKMTLMTVPCQWLRFHDEQHRETRHSRQKRFSQWRHLNLFEQI